MLTVRTFFTTNGTPSTGLSPTIRIRKVVDGSLVVTDESMLEVGDGWYKYNFAQYTGSIDYAMRADGGASVPGYERYTTLGNDNFVTDIFAYDITSLTSGNKMGEAVNFILNTENGGWKIENNQLIIYKPDNATEVVRFNLFDADGSPSSKVNPAERKRV